MELKMKLSMLDQAMIGEGYTAQQALEHSLELAQLGDKLGYHRFWMAEHHNSKNLASTAPEISIAIISAKTKSIRLGTGGVMMMHYSALKLAEVFNTLSAYNPGRIDLGVGRAPGGDPYATYALAQGIRVPMMDQYDKLQATLDLMSGKQSDQSEYKHVVASPYDVPLTEAWLLGSSGNSARKAGELGVGYAFAEFFNGEASKEIFDIYRQRFQPSSFMAKPEILITYSATIAETKEEAEYRARPVDIFKVNLMTGKLGKILTPEQAKDYPLTEMDLSMIKQHRKYHLVGTPQEIAEQLQKRQELYGAHEAMINCTEHTQEDRVEGYTLLAKELF